MYVLVLSILNSFFIVYSRKRRACDSFQILLHRRQMTYICSRSVHITLRWPLYVLVHSILHSSRAKGLQFTPKHYFICTRWSINIICSHSLHIINFLFLQSTGAKSRQFIPKHNFILPPPPTFPSPSPPSLIVSALIFICCVHIYLPVAHCMSQWRVEWTTVHFCICSISAWIIYMCAQITVWPCLVSDKFGLFTEIAVCK